MVFGGHSSGKTELIQQTDYYPFGLVVAQKEYIAYEELPGHEVLKNKNLYNGKEWQDDEIGGVKLDWYDYGARMYDPQLGRWHTIDPLAEWEFSQSPYHYVANNPLINIDPDGNFKTKFGAWLWKTFNGGGETLQDNKTKEYFVSQRVENKGDADITIKRVFHGQRSYSRSENGIQMQNGGYSGNGTGGESIDRGHRAKHNFGTLEHTPFFPQFGIFYLLNWAFRNRDYSQSDEKTEEHGTEPIPTPDKKVNPENKTNNRGEQIDNNGDSIIIRVTRWKQSHSWPSNDRNGEGIDVKIHRKDSAETVEYFDKTTHKR